MVVRAVVVLLFAMSRGAAPAAHVCLEAGVVLSRVAVEGARATPYTLSLPTLDACVSSCNGSHWCRAVVFKGLGVSGNPTCGAANETCCCAPRTYIYRLESQRLSSHADRPCVLFSSFYRSPVDLYKRPHWAGPGLGLIRLNGPTATILLQHQRRLFDGRALHGRTLHMCARLGWSPLCGARLGSDRRHTVHASAGEATTDQHVVWLHY